MQKFTLKRPERQYPYYNFNIYCLVPENIFIEITQKISTRFAGASLNLYKIENKRDIMVFVEAKHGLDLKETRQMIAGDIYAMIDKLLWIHKNKKQTV